MDNKCNGIETLEYLANEVESACAGAVAFSPHRGGA
jgi:hypothetical protein